MTSRSSEKSSECFSQKTSREFQSVIPSLIVNGAAKAIEVYKKAFDAQELHRMQCPDTGKVLHACIQIGNTKLFVSDMNPRMTNNSPSLSSFYLYLDDVDTAFKKANAVTEINEISPVEDMFWGDRVGIMKDSFGIQWTLATHVRDVTPEELKEGQKKFAAKKKAA